MMDMVQMIRMIRSNHNPMQMLAEVSKQNPVVGQVMRIANGKTPKEMENIAREMAKQRGVDIEQVAQSMGLKLPK